MHVLGLIYTRVSDDQRDGRSPAEQEIEARAVCEREGWDVLEVLTDSAGASRHSRRARPGWERAKALIADGAVDVLVTWEASRAERKLAGVAELIDLCAAHGVLWSYKGRTYDPAKSADRFAIGLDGLVASREADETSERVQRAMRQGAAQGRPHGRLLYGYRRDYELGHGRKPALVRQYPDPETAPVVRRIFAEYLSGKGSRSIASELNVAGLDAPKGGEWNDLHVRRILRNPAYAGLRSHRGQLSRERWEGWESLVPVDMYERAQARLVRMGERNVRQRQSAHLLTGVLRCGVCLDAGRSGRMRVNTAGTRAMYSCRERHCVARSLPKLDAHVVRLVLERLALPDVGETLAASTDAAVERARQQAEELRAELAEAFELWRARKLSASAYARMEADIEPRIAEAERAARRAMVPLELDDLPPAERVDAWWDGLDAERQREVIAALIVVVVVRPLEPGMWPRRFYPELVEIDWR
jgi:site-specific DNA recombinase